MADDLPQPLPPPVVGSALEPVLEVPHAGEELPDSLVAAMLADPVHSPEHLALAAVRLCGPQAGRWVEQTRRSQPQLSTGELAMAVREKFTRFSQVHGAATGALGLPGAMVDVGLVAWNQARMILYLAAVHHLDPTERERAAEILYFTGVYKAVALAEKAVDVTAGRAKVGSLLPISHGSRTMAGLRVAAALSAMLGKRTVKRLATRAIPLGSVPIGAWSNGKATRALADRVVVEYARRLGVILHHRAAKGPLPPGPQPWRKAIDS